MNWLRFFYTNTNNIKASYLNVVIKKGIFHLSGVFVTSILTQNCPYSYTLNSSRRNLVVLVNILQQYCKLDCFLCFAPTNLNELPLLLLKESIQNIPFCFIHPVHKYWISRDRP